MNIDTLKLTKFYLLIGKNVKRIRKEKKISQQKLANMIGHDSVGHIAKAEICKYNKHFNLEQIFKIACVLEVEINEFFKEID